MLPVRSIFFSSGISTHMMRVLISTSLKKSVEILHSFSFSAIDDFSVSYIYYTAAKYPAGSRNDTEDYKICFRKHKGYGKYFQ